MKIETTVEHLEKIVAVIDKQALDQIVIQAVAKEARVNLKRPGLRAEVAFKDATEGSPPYVVGQTAIVRITIDHADQTAGSIDETASAAVIP
jgi:hypothetical protein